MYKQNPAPMKETTSIVLRLQGEAMEGQVAVATLLRKAKLVASKLDLTVPWIDHEINGYLDGAELPDYRQVRGQTQARHFRFGWHPLPFQDPEVTEKFSNVSLRNSLGELEATVLNADNDGGLLFPFPPPMQADLISTNPGYTEFGVGVSKSQVAAVLEGARMRIFDWSLTLAKAGVLAEDVRFSPQEQQVTGPIVQQVIYGNVGVLGDVSGQARVSNTQSAMIDIGAARDLADQTRAMLPHLPSAIQPQMRAALDEVDGELRRTTPSPTLLRSMLGTVRTIAEGAAGNIAAAGILSLLNSILSAGA